MKFRIIFVFVYLVCSFVCKAQRDLGYGVLGGNDMKVSFNSRGAMRPSNHDYMPGGLLVPANNEPTPLSVLYSMDLHFGGYDATLNSSFNFSSFGYVGPLFIPSNGDRRKWNRTWVVEKEDIDAFIQDFEDGVINDPIPLSILGWPGMNNIHSERLYDIKLNPDLNFSVGYAPFFDRNQDLIYNPYDGDYPTAFFNRPDIKAESIGWSIYNGRDYEPFEKYENKVTMEVHNTFFSFCGSVLDPVNRAVFVNTSLLYSGRPLIDFALGYWIDADLGNFNDDYFGTDTLRNSIYFYNANAFDSSIVTRKIFGYGRNPPIFRVTTLNEKLRSSTYSVARSSDWGGSSELRDPISRNEIYNLLNGRTAKSNHAFSPIGFGYSPGSKDTTRFLFTGDPSDKNSWSMLNLQKPTGQWDLRVYAGIDVPRRIETYYEGSFLTLLSYHRDTSLNIINQIKASEVELDSLIEFAKNFLNNPCTPNSICNDDCVWPGDLDDNGVVNNHDFLLLTLSKGFTTIPREKISTKWLPLNSMNTGEYIVNGKDQKFADVNGSGGVTQRDFIDLLLNFGNRNSNFSDWGGSTIQGNELYFVANGPGSASLVPMLGGLAIGTEISGYAFTIAAGSFDFNNSGFYDGQDTSVLMYRFNNDIVVASKRGFVYTGPTPLLKDLNFGISRNLDDNKICFTNFQFLDKYGSVIPIGASCINIGPTVSSNDIYASDFEVFPNPAHSEIFIPAVANFQKITIRDLKGVEHKSEVNPSSNGIRISVQDLSTGLYLVEAIDENAVRYIAKVSVIH
jgi:hypothetical protein